MKRVSFLKSGIRLFQSNENNVICLRLRLAAKSIGLIEFQAVICAPQETQLGSACGTGAPPTVATHVYSRLRARTFQLCVKYPPISPHPIAPWCSFSSLFRVAAVGGVRTFTVAGCTYVLLELVVHSHHSYNPFLSPPFVRVLQCPPPPHPLPPARLTSVRLLTRLSSPPLCMLPQPSSLRPRTS